MDGYSTCGSDNLMGCCRAGCSAVGASTTESYGACSEQSSFTCQNGFYQLPAMSSTSPRISSMVRRPMPVDSSACAASAPFLR